jgi:hypothetical protein
MDRMQWKVWCLWVVVVVFSLCESSPLHKERTTETWTPLDGDGCEHTTETTGWFDSWRDWNTFYDEFSFLVDHVYYCSIHCKQPLDTDCEQWSFVIRGRSYESDCFNPVGCGPSRASLVPQEDQEHRHAEASIRSEFNRLMKLDTNALADAFYRLVDTHADKTQAEEMECVPVLNQSHVENESDTRRVSHPVFEKRNAVM